MKGKKAFTLTELLIAAAVFSLVMYGVVSILRGTRMFSQRIGAREDVQESAMLCLRKLMDELSDATMIVYPVLNADGSPSSRNYIVYRTFEDETAFLYLDPNDGAVKRATVHWNPSGTGFEPLSPVVLQKSEGFRELLFTIAGNGTYGTHVRLALRVEKSWFFEAVKPWNTRQ